MQHLKLRLEDLHIGRIAFIGRELGEESDHVAEENDNLCAIYHDRAQVEGEVTYESQEKRTMI